MDILAPNRFFRGAEMEYLLFDPKNGVLAANSENHLRASFSCRVTSPNGHIGPKSFFSWCRDGILAVWPQKRCPSCKFRKPSTSFVFISCEVTKWTYCPKLIFSCCRDGILAVWPQKLCPSCKFRKPSTSFVFIYCEVTKWTYWPQIDFFIVPRWNTCGLTPKTVS